MKTKLFLLMFAFGALTFTSCKRCCSDGSTKVCKEGYTKEQWDTIKEGCKNEPGCTCGPA